MLAEATPPRLHFGDNAPALHPTFLVLFFPKFDDRKLRSALDQSQAFVLHAILRTTGIGEL
jgi:hypothetical protein